MRIQPLSRCLTQYFPQYLLGAAVISITSVACTSGLRDYTQLNLKAQVPAESTEEATAETLTKTQAALEKRLLNLGISTAEISAVEPTKTATDTTEPDQILVRIPKGIAPEIVAQALTSTNQLTLHNQKPETEEDLSTQIETLQRLLVEQNNLVQTDKAAEAIALQPQINKARTAILALFEPTELNGDRLLDAQAVQISGFNTWEVRIWLDTQGTEMFAEQTKALAGTGRAIGIFLDDVLLSAPIVDITYAETGIEGGEATISGNFTAEAAQELEQQLKTGALPVDLEIVEITSSDEPIETEAQEPTAKEEEPTEEAPEEAPETSQDEDTAKDESSEEE
ncbi:MAG: hypothetical protein AAFN12_05755 [Cyanobacteria bacterium J06560_2]